MAEATLFGKKIAPEICFECDRVDTFRTMLARMASGDVDARLPISARQDALDAMAHDINVLVASAEARHGAMLRAIPDLMFVLLRDGTYVDYYARDPTALFVAPSAFIGRTVREVLPPALAAVMMDALERAFLGDDPVLVEYELPMGEPRFFEARIVRLGTDRLLSIVRDVTQAKLAAELNRDLARRLISRQEEERQRIGRELHDDVSQRLAVMNIEIAAIATEVELEPLRKRLRDLHGLVSEIATDVHHMSYELHPARLRLGLVGALQSLCRDMSTQRNLDIAFTYDAVPPSLDANVSLCLYRIVQETLHNVVRHSRVREAQVSVTCDESYLELQVADSGVGFDPTQVGHAGLGLVSIRERAASLDGQLAIDAAPGGGTKVTVRIPLGPQATSSTPPYVTSA